MSYLSTPTLSLSHGAIDLDILPPPLEVPDWTDDEQGSESDGGSFVSARVQLSGVNSPQAPPNHQPDASGSRNVAATRRAIDDEMPALMSCSSSEASGEYTDSEEDVRNETNLQPNEEAVADEWEDEAGDFENYPGDFAGYDDFEGLRGLFPPGWTANATTGNAPLSPSWSIDAPEMAGTLEDMNNMLDLLLAPNSNFTRSHNTDNNQAGEERAKKILSALEVIDEDLLERFLALKAGSGEDGRGCAVCYEDLKVLIGNVVALPCTHVFHENCLLPWFQNRSTCPSCRFDLDPERLVHRGFPLFLSNLLPPPVADTAFPTPHHLTGSRPTLPGVFNATIQSFNSDDDDQEREARERIRADLESHISTSFNVTTTAGYDQAGAYVRQEMHRTRHEVTTLELRMSDVQARRLRHEVTSRQSPSETREAIAQELQSMSLTVRDLTNQLEELRSLGARLQIHRQQQELHEFMTTGRDLRPVLQDNRPSPHLRPDPPSPPLSSPVFAPTLLPPIDLPTRVGSGPSPARVSNVYRRTHQDRDRRVPDPMPLVQDRARDTSRPFFFEYPVTPINDENDPGAIASSSRQASRNNRRRASDRVPLSQLDDAVEENDDRYLNEMLPPSQRPTPSTTVVAPQGSPAEVEAMLMATSSDDDDEPRFDSRNVRRRQFRTRSPAMVMRTRITGEQHALLLSESSSREDRHPGSPVMPGGRPATPVGAPVFRQPPLELRGAGTPVLDVEMQDTHPVRIDPFVIPPSPIVRDPRVRASHPRATRRRVWYPQEDPDDLPPLEDAPVWPASPVTPRSALEGYITGYHIQAAWDALWEPQTTDPPATATIFPHPTRQTVLGPPIPGPRAPPKEYARPTGKSIREWIEQRERALDAESSGGARAVRAVAVEEVRDGEA